MNYLYAFLFAGAMCSLGQIILDNTKLTPGHITSLYTVLGAILSFLGIYDKLVNTFGSGATVLISNFGHSLYSAAYEGFLEEGFLGIFSNMFANCSATITAAVVCGIIVTVFFKSKN